MTDSAKTEPYAVHCVIPKHYNECSKCPPLSPECMPLSTTGHWSIVWSMIAWWMLDQLSY